MLNLDRIAIVCEPVARGAARQKAGQSVRRLVQNGIGIPLCVRIRGPDMGCRRDALPVLTGRLDWRLVVIWVHGVPLRLLLTRAPSQIVNRKSVNLFRGR